MSPSTICLLIPIRNELKSLEDLRPYIEVADEVIFVDGNSTDGSVEFIQANFPTAKIVSQNGARGKGHAIALGLLEVRSEYVMQVDADFPISTKEILEIKALLTSDKSIDLIKPSRHLPTGGSADLTAIRRIGAKTLASIARLLFRVPWTEVCYAMWTIRTSKIHLLEIERLLSRRNTIFFNQLNYALSFEFDQYCFLKFLKAGCKILEIPTFELARKHGHSSLNAVVDGSRTLMVLLVERING
jgi:glycosyltransferase involved in cell wall biosynthesis